MMALPKLICKLISIMIMNSMSGLSTSNSNLLCYKDSFIDHCIILDAYLHYSGKAIRKSILFSLHAARTKSKFTTYTGSTLKLPVIKSNPSF